MELVLVHITDIHLENDTDYNILEGRSEYIAPTLSACLSEQKFGAPTGFILLPERRFLYYFLHSPVPSARAFWCIFIWK